ncbi:MAG: cation diffusion facilitator CzcD-associated flavoprotein CzcO [Acidimicrobiales bacterium]|jgi:cation diffusion facilitator CzcD-associated flavoprotein CzcO
MQLDNGQKENVGSMNTEAANPEHHEAIIIGAGLSGIYQLYRLAEMGMDVACIEAADDLGGTWYKNRYPGCRFDSESYTYGYSFSEELLDEWHWSEHFSSQPENLRYLNHVAAKFDLRRHMQFGCKVEQAAFDEQTSTWNVKLIGGRTMSCRFLITAIGVLSTPTMPRIEGIDDFEGQSFHTYNWPKEPVDLVGKKVAVIGTGATAVQLIAEIADKVGELFVFQRRPNWCAPLHNAKIDEAEMADIRSRYSEIFELCATTAGGFIHQFDRRGTFEVAEEERYAFFEELYASSGFRIWQGNFLDVMMKEEANAEFSGFVAAKIRERVNDPVLAEKLIPKDHGFGTRRVPMETNYYEAYNRDNVHLVDINDTPIERVTESGLRTSERDYDVDLIVYATGFDAMTGAFDRMDIVGRNGQSLRDKWSEGPVTYLGLQVGGFPNMIMLAGPQAGSGFTNFGRGVEETVDWTTELVRHARDNGHLSVDVTPEAEAEWGQHVADMYSLMLLGKVTSWFTGYNSNVEGHEAGNIRHVVYNGGAPRYRKKLADVAENDYHGFVLA